MRSKPRHETPAVGPERRFARYPAPALRGHVERLWGWENAGPLPLPLVTPGLGAEIFFHHGTALRSSVQGVEREHSQGHLLCVRHAPLQFLEQRDVGFTVARIRAGALGRFTRIPLRDLKDSQLEVPEIWGRAGAETVERVADAKTQEERATIIEQFLLDRLLETQVDAIAERALQLIYRCPDISIPELAEGCGLGRRQLERRVTNYFGQSPVELRCLARFYRVVRRLVLEPSRDTLQSGLEAGYFDQSHLIRDFKRFTGMTPQAFRNQAAAKTHFYNPSSRAGSSLGFDSRSTRDDSLARRASRSATALGNRSHEVARAARIDRE
ncbi:MAG TPA: helix-turn-helix domain-containing protein [Polyangiaceae bacterium]|nr:helix-turn-helix domain-containing protein [Polyangiaceae bacterium]